MAFDARAMLEHLEQRREMSEVVVAGRPRPPPAAPATLGIWASITLTAVLLEDMAKQAHDSRAAEVSWSGLPSTLLLHHVGNYFPNHPFCNFRVLR